MITLPLITKNIAHIENNDNFLLLFSYIDQAGCCTTEQVFAGKSNRFWQGKCVEILHGANSHEAAVLGIICHIPKIP